MIKCLSGRPLENIQVEAYHNKVCNVNWIFDTFVHNPNCFVPYSFVVLECRYAGYSSSLPRHIFVQELRGQTIGKIVYNGGSNFTF